MRLSFSKSLGSGFGIYLSRSLGAKKDDAGAGGRSEKGAVLKSIAQALILLGRFLQRCGYVASSDFELNGPDFFKRSENSALFDRLIDMQKNRHRHSKDKFFRGRYLLKGENG